MADVLPGLVRSDPQPSFLKQILRILHAIAPYQPSSEPSGIAPVELGQCSVSDRVPPRGGTRSELAFRASMKRSYLSDLERGTRNPAGRRYQRKAAPGRGASGPGGVLGDDLGTGPQGPGESDRRRNPLGP